MEYGMGVNLIMGKKRYFIITIDTEGDNLWEWKEGSLISTENVKYLSRFQNLCDSYQFKPTWLANWEMLNDDRFVDFAEKFLGKKQCEIGMHLHAWNTPPYYGLPKGEHAGLPYLIEYPEDVMKEKIITMTKTMEEKFGRKPFTHRAGRWAVNDTYFKLLRELGYIADCSITPFVNWKTNAGQTPYFWGSDYSKEKTAVSIREGIIEVPVTTLWSEEKNRVLWLRPNRINLEEMLYVIGQNRHSGNDYLMFMLHSSELMPGGSPTFKTQGGIEILYEHLNIIFNEISQTYVGVGLEEYVMLHNYFAGL